MKSKNNIGKKAKVVRAGVMKEKKTKPKTGAKDKTTELRLPSGIFKVSRRNGVSTLNDDGKKINVCDYIAFEANRENDKTDKVSVLVEFTDHQGKTKEASLPREDFGYPNRLIERLLSLGFCIHDQKLAMSFLSESYQTIPPKRNIRVVNEPGWQNVDAGNLKVYVINDKTLTPAGQPCNIALDESVNAGFTSKGSNKEWSKQIATKCIGNSRFTLMVCAGLSGPMLDLEDAPNSGIHINGNTKAAKTTCLEVTRSIFGNDDYGSSWNATTGALQETARSRNHGALFLDEISQCEAKEVSKAVYDLMNGVNKNRLTPDCKLSSVSRNRMVVISTGEYSVQEHLQQGGIKVKPGQLVRLPSIPVSRTKGMFPNLHGETTIGALAAKLRASCEDNYGTIGLTWIQHLVDNQVELRATLPARVRAIQTQLLDSIQLDEPSEGQRDVAKSFASKACAGEEAISCGIMPWPEGTAIKAAKVCIRAWHRHEAGEAIKREPFPSIKKYFSENQKNFVSLGQYNKARKSSVFTHVVDGVKVFLVTRENLEATLFKQFGKKAVETELKKRDLLVLGSGNRPARQVPIPMKPEIPKPSFYAIRASILTIK